jgi:nicotinamide riboside transporter PnuC
MESPSNGHEPIDVEPSYEEARAIEERRIDYVPQYRDSYPRWIVWVLGVILVVVALFVATLLELRPLWYLILSVAAVVGVALWRLDSNRELRRHVPPAGWKSEIKPDELVNMDLSYFDTMMRFRLKGDKNDDLENHRVRWASRYSGDVIHISRLLTLVAVACLVGALVFRHVTITWNSEQLPQTYYLVRPGLIVCLVLLLSVGIMRFHWHYRTLMLDETFLYFLFEMPAWLPWSTGQRDPIRLSLISMADPQDTSWGKRNGHGTVILTYQRGFTTLTKPLRRVPNHHEFCDAINSVREGGMSYGGMGVIY